MRASDALPSILLVIMIAAMLTGVVMTIRAEDARRAEAKRLADERAAERLRNPPPPDVALQERLDALEAANAARYDSLKSRIFWTPLIWAVIGAVLWGIGTALSRA